MPAQWGWLAYFLAGFTVMFILLNGVLLLAAGMVYAERRLLGRFQVRLGPNRVGPFGLLQPFADIIKLILKEDVVPRGADVLLFTAAPVMMVAPLFLITAVIPFGKNSYLADLNVGVLYLVAVTAISTLAIFLGGWATGNRYAMFGAMRAVAQLISYEVPLVLALVGVVLLAGSMSLVQVVESQRLPFLLLQPLGFFVFFAATSAELNRTPFDLMEAESEIIAGYHIEYTGMRFGLFQLAEFGGVVVSSAVMTTLFLRGWENPFVPQGWPQVLPSHLWFLLKTLFFVFLFIWVRASWPRLRIDQVMGFAWKVLLPLALINLVVTGVEVWLWPHPATVQLWGMVLINWVVAGACLVGFSAFMERWGRRPTATVVPVRLSVEVR
ncbi:MAG: NADH-quinone oxidoreductase subunit NuoH [Dehalococcoidia bacterium]